MSGYGVLLPGFWDGETGQAIATAGGYAAQLVGLYLTSNKDATMIGLYPVKLLIVRERISTLTLAQVKRGMAALSVAGFAEYDLATEHVWVREMARYRLGIDKEKAKQKERWRGIDPKDNRAAGVLRLYERVIPNPLLKPFYDRYRTDLRLPKPKPYQGDWHRLPSPLPGPLKPKGALKPDIRDQGSGITEQISGSALQGDQEQRGAPRSFHGEAREAYRVLLRLAHDVFAAADGTEADSELSARLKDLAGEHRVPYDSRAIAKALESAAAQRRRSA